MSSKRDCDCTSYCGSDPGIAAGEAVPCKGHLRYQQHLADLGTVATLALSGVGRVGDNEKALILYFEQEPTDDEMRALYETLKGLMK